MNPSPRIQKKYEQKNVLPARARDIYHPSYTFSSTQYRRYNNTASALPPGGDPSQRVRALKATFHHWGRTIFFLRVSRGFCFFCILDESRVSVGCLRNSVNVGLWWIILPKFFVRTSTILYGRECVFAKIFPFFSLLLSKVVVSDFIQNFIKRRRRVLLKTQCKRERERDREKKEHFFTSQYYHLV